MKLYEIFLSKGVKGIFFIYLKNGVFVISYCYVQLKGLWLLD